MLAKLRELDAAVALAAVYADAVYSRQDLAELLPYAAANVTKFDGAGVYAFCVHVLRLLRPQTALLPVQYDTIVGVCQAVEWRLDR
jgi:hypothetical protein